MNRQLPSSNRAEAVRRSSDESTTRHWSARVVYVAASALVFGVLAGFVWLAYTMQIVPARIQDELSFAPTVTPPLTAPTVAAVDSPTISATLAEAKPLTLAEYNEVEGKQSAKRVVSAAASRSTQQPSPTAIVYLESLEAVAGMGGATMWNEDGSLAFTLSQGEYISAIKRSDDGHWIHGVTEEGESGWILTEELIIFDIARLAHERVTIIPITPTPQADLVQAGAEAISNSQPLISPTPTVNAGKAIPTVDAIRPPTARIALDDARLNVRAGPGAEYRVIAKALPQEMYELIAVSNDKEWILLSMPQVTGGVGWVAADYLLFDTDLNVLPESRSVSVAPAHVEAVAAPDEPTPEINSDLMPEPTAAPAIPLPPSHKLGLPPVQSRGTLHSGVTGRLVLQQSWGGSIYLYDLTTGELHLLTGGFDPSFSPDGSLVTFTREGGENGVYIIDVENGEETLVFGGRENLRSPKFNPDGKYIVFERGDQSIRCKGEFWRCRLSVYGPDGELPESETQPSLARIRIDGSDYWDPMDLPYARVPDWNEGGIVYQSLSGLQLAQNEPNVKPVEVTFDIQKQYEMDPDWQPNAGAIAYQQKELSHWEIYTVNPDGSSKRALTRPSSPLAESLPSNVSPAWSPDGRHIVFLSNRTAENTAGEWGVWVMEADGSNQRRLPIELPFTYTYVSEQMLDWGP